MSAERQKQIYEAAAAVLDAQRNDLAAELFLDFIEQVRTAPNEAETFSTLGRFLLDHRRDQS